MIPSNQPQPVQAPHGDTQQTTVTPAPSDWEMKRERDRQCNEGARRSFEKGAATPARTGKLIRLPSVEDKTALKKSTIYAGVRSGSFPAPVRLSARAVAWREEDVNRWIAGRESTGSAA